MAIIKATAESLHNKNYDCLSYKQFEMIGGKYAFVGIGGIGGSEFDCYSDLPANARAKYRIAADKARRTSKPAVFYFCNYAS